MNNFAEQIRERLEAAIGEQAKIASERENILKRESEVGKKVEALRFLLSAETGQNGSNRPSDQSHVSQAGSASYTSAAQAVREMIKRAGPVGIGYKELGKKLEAEGFNVHSNYVYTVASSLKKSGDIRVINGNIVWQPSLPKDSAKTSAD